MPVVVVFVVVVLFCFSFVFLVAVDVSRLHNCFGLCGLDVASIEYGLFLR